MQKTLMELQSLRANWYPVSNRKHMLDWATAQMTTTYKLSSNDPR